VTEARLPERAPSLVALAAAFEALDVAALHVAGVREWVERVSAVNYELEDDEAVRLWAFVEQTREAVGRVRDDADRLAALLLEGFLGDRERWPLTPEQEREFHEVLATLGAREAEAHRAEVAEQRPTEDAAAAAEGGD
jgi:hypothetical protein